MKSVRSCYSFNTVIHVIVDGPSTGERLSLLFMLLVFIVSWFKFIPSVLFLLLRTESPYLEVFLCHQREEEGYYTHSKSCRGYRCKIPPSLEYV
jgi:hypothetical protein